MFCNYTLLQAVLGVQFNSKKADFVMEITAKTQFPHPVLRAPDGSVYNG